MVGDNRGQLSLVADFAKHLGAAPDTLVTVLQPPVDTQSGKTLKSGDENSMQEAPRFSFRLTRKL
jgi:predicted NBD/HSP70 family sugar kinase